MSERSTARHRPAAFHAEYLQANHAATVRVPCLSQGYPDDRRSAPPIWASPVALLSTLVDKVRDAAATRPSPDGSLDPTFGDGGQLVVDDEES